MNNHPSIQLKTLSCRLGDRPILQDISFAIPSGSYVSLIGANGAGKSTLLRCLLGQISYVAEQCELLGRPRNEFASKEFGRCVAYVPQQLDYPVEFTVREFVALGRYPHLSPFSMLAPKDRDAIDHALDATGIAALSGRSLNRLSGGERRLACIAAAVAQDAQIFLLDEPLAHLDYRFQVRVQSVLQQLRDVKDRTLVVVTHDIDSTVFRSSRVLALREGRLILDGTPADLLHGTMLEEIYATPFERLENSEGDPVVIPHEDRS